MQKTQTTNSENVLVSGNAVVYINPDLLGLEDCDGVGESGDEAVARLLES